VAAEYPPRTMSYLWQRFIHFLIAVIFLTFGIGLTVFVYSNTTSVNIDWWQFHFTNVPLGMVALIPLLVGVVLGYLYHVPSGLHDFTQSMRKGRRIGELEHEIKELQRQLDRVLGMPDDSAPPAAAPMAPVMPAAHVEAHPAAHEARPATKTRAIHEVKTEPAPADSPAHPAKAEPGKPHAGDHPTHREPAPSA
jgi:uncharacterized integral membrane protein